MIFCHLHKKYDRLEDTENTEERMGELRVEKLGIDFYSHFSSLCAFVSLVP
jgi:hypothetical protein